MSHKKLIFFCILLPITLVLSSCVSYERSANDLSPKRPIFNQGIPNAWQLDGIDYYRGDEILENALDKCIEEAKEKDKKPPSLKVGRDTIFNCMHDDDWELFEAILVG